LPQTDRGLNPIGGAERIKVLEKYSIKVNILNRPYPLLVQADEEESVRNAAKLINDRIKVYKERFSVQDEMDLVIMCCLELATDNFSRSQLVQNDIQSAMASLEKVDESLNNAILNVEETAAGSRV